jgi:hypothetical protein
MHSTKTLKIRDLISLICDLRNEAYAFERHLALLTFGLWVVEPNDIAFVKHGRLVGAAQIVRSLSRKQLTLPSQRKFLEVEFSTDLITSAIISPTVIGPLSDEIEGRQSNFDLAESVVFTFLSAPPPKEAAKRPSLNKAIHFILNGGFDPNYKASHATIKKQWVNHAETTPFLLAEEDSGLKLIGVPPDTPEWLKSSTEALKKPRQLREYFGMARQIQLDLMSKLDPVSLKRFQFVEFPSEIEPVELQYPPMTDEQLKIYKGYKAPKFTPN